MIKLCIVCRAENVSCSIDFLNFPSEIYYPDQKIIKGTIRINATNNNECNWTLTAYITIVRPDGQEEKAEPQTITLNPGETKSVDIPFSLPVDVIMPNPYGTWTIKVSVD